MRSTSELIDVETLPPAEMTASEVQVKEEAEGVDVMVVDVEQTEADSAVNSAKDGDDATVDTDENKEKLLSVSIKRDAETGTFGFTVVSTEKGIVVDEVPRRDYEDFPLRTGDRLTCVAVFSAEESSSLTLPFNAPEWRPLTLIEEIEAAMETATGDGAVCFRVARSNDAPPLDDSYEID